MELHGSPCRELSRHPKAVWKSLACCWFNLARGATPLIAMKKSFLRLYLSKQIFDQVEYANKHIFFAESGSERRE